MGSVRTNSHQLLDFFERKAQTLHSLHESQAFDVVRRIKAKPTCAAEGRWQELATLIKPDGIDAQSSPPCEFADLKCWWHGILNARHGKIIQSGVRSRVKNVFEEWRESTWKLRRSLSSSGQRGRIFSCPRPRFQAPSRPGASASRICNRARQS